MKLAWLSVSLLVALLATGCLTGGTKAPGVARHEIVIGSSAALSGHARFLGEQYTRGAQLYLNDLNARGGVHGRKVKLLAYDDQYDPVQTAANTTRLLTSDQVFALCGYVGTPTTAAVLDAIHRSGTPLLGCLTGAQDLRVPLRPRVFHVRDSYNAECEAVVAQFADKLKLKKVAVLGPDDAFGAAVTAAAKVALTKRQLAPVATATYARGTLDVDAAVASLKASGAEAIIMAGTAAPLAKFVKLALDAKFTSYCHAVSFVGAEALSRELLTVQKVPAAAAERVLVTQVVPSPLDEKLPAVADYRRLAQQYYPEDVPNHVALEGYLNAVVLVKALEAAGPKLTREAFVAALEDLRDADLGIGKKLSFSPVDHVGLSGVYLTKLGADGRFAPVAP